MLLFPLWQEYSYKYLLFNNNTFDAFPIFPQSFFLQGLSFRFDYFENLSNKTNFFKKTFLNGQKKLNLQKFCRFRQTKTNPLIIPP